MKEKLKELLDKETLDKEAILYLSQVLLKFGYVVYKSFNQPEERDKECD